MRTVADRIGAWISRAGDAWTLDDGAVAWARSYGVDARLAWRECPRADYLVALAADVGFDLVLLRRETCRVARSLVALAPEHGALLAAMAEQAESWMRGAAVPAALPRAHREAAQGLRDTSRLANEEEERAMPYLEVSLAATIESTRESFADLPDTEKVDTTAAVLVALSEPHQPLAKHWRFHRGRQERASTAYALRAAVASVAFAKIAELRATSRAVLASPACAASSGEALRRKTVSRIADLERRLYAQAGEVFHFASLARGWSWGATDEARRRGFTALARASVAASGSAPIDLARSGALIAAFEVAIVEEMDEKTADALRANADAIRATAHVAELAFDPSDDTGASDASEASTCEGSVADLVRASSSIALESVLTELLAADTHATDVALSEAIAVAIAVLNAPGPLPGDTLARVMITLNERFSGLVRDHGRSAGAGDRERWANLGEKLEKQSRIYSDWLRRAPSRALD